MRHTITIMIYGVLLSLGLLIQSTEAKRPGVQYLGLTHQPHFSPDGRHNVVIVEDRYPGGSLFSLMFWTMDEEGFWHHNAYGLTPKYKEFVAVPDGRIGFVRFDTVDRYVIQSYDPKEKKMLRPWDGASIKMKHLQFSKDMRSYCVFMDQTAHPLASLKTQIQKKIAPSGWHIYTKEEGMVRTETGSIFFKKGENEAFTEWAPIEKPKVIPQLFTQPMPKITLETQMRWAPDGNYIYVLDKTGIWRVTPYPTLCPMWTKIINAPRISNLQISSTGKHLLYEVRPDLLTRSDEENKDDPFGLHNEIWLVDIETIIKPIRPTREDAIAAKGDVWQLDISKELKPRIIAKGWGATFNPSGKAINYANEEGHFLLDFETLKSVRVFLTSYTIHYKRSILD